MVKTSLVTPDIELGERVLRKLDAAKFPVSAVLWVLNEEEFGSWRLIIATPIYDKVGVFPAYDRLHEALDAGEPGLFLEAAPSLKGNRDPFIKGLRSRFGKASSVSGMRFGGHSIGDFWVDDAYIYRVR